MNTEIIILVVGIISSLIVGFIGGFFAGAYWKTKWNRNFKAELGGRFFMIQIKKESIIKTYREKDILIETIKQFHYSTEEEKTEHCKLMKDDGFTDSDQVKENIGTVMKPEYVWFGSYYKYEVENRY